jgi:Zn-dependent protease with chaperone function
MAETLPASNRLPNISARAFEHPADRAATAALKTIPMLDTVVRKLIEFQYEQALRILDLPDVPDLYLTQFPIANAAAIGAGKPMVLVNSRLVELLEDDELRGVFGHEAAHILADHVLYRTALIILLNLSGIGKLPALAGLPLLGVRLALLEWFRAAELSCDRAATLVTRDPLVTCRTLMVMAGGSSSRKLNLDAFIRQAGEYEDWDSGWDRLSRIRSELTLTHAYPVRRVREVMRWVQSGDYDRIVGGDYVRRDAEPGVRAETSDAVEFYAERFRQAFRDAGETVSKAGDQLAGASGKVAEWLRGGKGGD